MAMEAICRLCADVSSADGIICTIDDHDLNIRQKLIDCCRWDELHDSAADFYPKNICKTCYGRLEICWNFSKSVARAQIKIFKLVEGGGGGGGGGSFDLKPARSSAVHVDVDMEPGNFCVESIPIEVNPIGIDPIKIEFDRNPIEGDELSEGVIDAFINPIEVFPSEKPRASKRLKKAKPSTQTKPTRPDSDSDVGCKDVFGSMTSLSSHDDDPMDAGDAAAVASANAAIAVSSADIEKLPINSKHLSASDFAALVKDKCNADGSVTADAIKEHQLVNWTLLQEICWICKWSAPDRVALRQHIHTEHPSEPVRIMCTLCTQSVTTRFRLMRHTKAAHYPYLVFCCNKCNVLFNGKRALKAHTCATFEAKGKRTQIICELCGRVLKNAGYLKTHMETHKPKEERQNFECYLCKQTGLLKRAVQAHMKYTHLPFEKRRFECDVCHVKFTTKTALTRHHMIHTNTYLCSCRYCGKKFRDKGGVTIHERKHTGERPFGCTVCDYRSREKPNLDKHMTQQHGISCYKTRLKPLKLKEHKRSRSLNASTIAIGQQTDPSQPSTSTFPWTPPLNFPNP